MSQREELMADPIVGRPEKGPETRYNPAKEGWDDRLGKLAVQAKNWRFGFFAAMGFAALSMGGMIYQSAKNSIVPVVITVDYNTGYTNVLGKAEDINYIPKAQEIRYFLTKLIVAVRAVPLDSVIIKKNWVDAYQFTRPAAASLLNEWARSPSGALSKIGQETVAVEVISVVPIAGSQSYQARWREQVFTSEGALKETYTMAGIFTIEIQSPRTEKAALVNPLGIFVTTFQWTRESLGGKGAHAQAVDEAAPQGAPEAESETTAPATSAAAQQAAAPAQ